MANSISLLELKSPRERHPAYRAATFPILLPKVVGILAILKFCSREAQGAAYYTTWVLETTLLCTLASWLAPALVPGVILWCLGAEILEEALETEEAFYLGFLFSLLRSVGTVELVLALCQSKRIELGKLLVASEQFSILDPSAVDTDPGSGKLAPVIPSARRSNAHRHHRDETVPSRTPGRLIRVNLIRRRRRRWSRSSRV